MKKPLHPPNETQRLADLCALHILDTPAEERFDRLTRLARDLFDVPIALISLVDEQRQWFKSKIGIDVCETSREISFCGHAVHSGRLLIVEDAKKDIRFADNPLVTEKPNIRFYAGYPLRSAAGNVLGTLCIIDFKPRKAEKINVARFHDLALLVEEELSKTVVVHEVVNQSRQLEVAMEHLSKHVENSPLAVIEWDRDFKVSQWSPSAEAVFGWALEEVRGKRPDEWRFVYQDDEEQVMQVMKEILSQRENRNTSHNRNYKKDGSFIYCNWYNSVLYDKEGQLLSFLSLVQDDTARFEAELALRESEHRFRDTFEQAAVGMAHVGLDGSWLRVNQKLCSIVGYSDTELHALTFKDITYPDDLDENTALLQKILNREIANYSFEKRYIHKQGHLVWVRVTVSLALDAQDHPLHLITIIEDIQSRKETQLELQQAKSELEMRVHARTQELSSKQKLLDAILDSINVGIVACDAQGQLTLFNKATKKFHGLDKVGTLPPEEWPKHYSLYAADGTTPLTIEQVPLYKALTGHPVVEDEMIVASIDGTRRTLLVSGQKLKDEDHHTFGAVVAMHDITERKQHESEMRSKELMLRSITDSIPALVSYVGKDGRYEYCNKQYEEFFGVRLDNIMGKTIEELLGKESYAPISHNVALALSGKETTFERPLTVQGRETFVSGHYIPDIKPDGSVSGFYVVLWDITQAKQRELTYKKQAEVDGMTGLYNKQAIHDLLALELQSHVAQGKEMAVMFLDLDHFKQINDQYGHDIGDELLKEFATRIKTTLRSTDLVGRFGGDEFLLVLPQTKSIAAVEKVAAKLLSRASEPFLSGDYQINFSTSIGIGYYQKDTTITDKFLLKMADIALYEAKGAGRNNFKIYSSN